MDFRHEQFHAGLLLNGRYETLAPLAHGSFGLVFTARDLITGNDVAIKCLKKSPPPPGSHVPYVDDAAEELKFHRIIGDHPHIVNLLDHFESGDHSYLVLEYCSQGDLYEAIRLDKGPKETEHVRDFMLQLVDAIETLHFKGIAHRDIKPENIFLTESGSMKLGDFGLATTQSWSYEIAVGSDRYMAPEQYDPQGQGLSPRSADIWSIGICLLNILFSRNPFAEPAQSDTLFKDFCCDRQSLFDVFPNLSQDTFEVLNHSLVIDPQKRSLQLLRDALERVVSFTTDDESLDDFCNENRDNVAPTANRQPLRTPSIASPPVENSGVFPWSQALHQVTPQHFRKLSIIADDVSEDLFPGADSELTDWRSKADTRSVESIGDSGLGLSVTSTAASPVTRSKPVPIAGSLPVRASNALSSLFGKKSKFESKSWSDMWEEEEEERAEQERMQKMSAFKPTHLSTITSSDEASDGHRTPRPIDVKERPFFARRTTNASDKSNASIRSKDDGVSTNTGFVFEELAHAPAAKYSPPSKRSGIMDRWSALGELRRGIQTPTKAAPAPPVATRKTFRPTTWRRPRHHNDKQPVDHSVWDHKQWALSTDWRRSEQSLPGATTRKNALQLDGHDSGDEVEWVGGPMEDLS